MKNSGSISFIWAIFIIPMLASILPATVHADQGIIITLENTGPSPITEAVLGFDLLPLHPDHTFEVTVGGGMVPSMITSNIGDFQIGVIPISQDNPLAPGGTACVGPLYQITSGDYLEFEGISSYGNGFSENPPASVIKLRPDVATFPFDVAHDSVQGGRLSGVVRFLTSIPDVCKTGYAPPFGKIMINRFLGDATSTGVDLSLSCFPTVGYRCQEMQFSNDNVNWSEPEPYKNDRKWILFPGDGEKTVYVKFKDNSGNWSDAYSETVILTAATLAPNGGEIIPSGSTYVIQWGAPFDALMFDLKYSTDNGSTWKTIARKVNGTSYQWHVPLPSNNKTNCLVKVICFDYSGDKVGEYVSDSAFEIEVVKATSPSAGDRLEAGNISTITWRTNGTVRPVASVKLFYSLNGGLSWKAIKTVKGNPGSYAWAVPDVPGPNSGCKVKIILKDAGGATVGSSISDGLFAIQ